MWFYPALNQLAGTGWLTKDELKNFISRLPNNTIGLTPNRPWNFSVIRQHPRQLIHSLVPTSLSGWFVLDQAKMNNKNGLRLRTLCYYIIYIKRKYHIPLCCFWTDKRGLFSGQLLWAWRSLNSAAALSGWRKWAEWSGISTPWHNSHKLFV